MRKIDILRHIPKLSKLVEAIDNLERYNAELVAENEQLKNTLQQVLICNETSLVESEVPGSSGTNGLLLPPAILRFLVAGTEDLEWFLHSGELGAQTLVEILARQGKTLDQFKSILDFGCGCGRVMRHLKSVSHTELHGADANVRAIQWCKVHLNFAQFEVNSLEPPLPYPGQKFELIYAFSVLTHLPESLQTRWMDELRRVLKPGGYLILSVHGDKFAESLLPAARAEYENGNLVFLGKNAGTNYCSAYHPERYVRGVLARNFEVLEFIPEGAKGNAPQDAYLLRSQT